MNRIMYHGIIAVLLLAGCATAPPVIEKKDVAAKVVHPAEETQAMPGMPSRLFEDRELLLDGVKLVNLPDGPAQAKARSVFLSLIQGYPQSRWRPAAEAFIRLIDEAEAFREATSRDQLLLDKVRAEKAKALQENETFKKTVRELTEKFQTEINALAQQNEQLKQDIQRLKTLEIELEKRERRLR